MGDWLFGCDICQEVCPWNHRAPLSTIEAFQPRAGLNPVQLREMFSWSDAQFRTVFRETPLWRAKRRGLLRNAAIVLGNQRDEESLPALTIGLQDAEPLVRGACAWSLGQSGERSRDVLSHRLDVESESTVRAEIEAALAGYDVDS
jgi:epoxyqueuosine reductase